MTSKSAGSSYHLSSLRYAQGNPNPVSVPSSLLLHHHHHQDHPNRSRFDEIFEKAEDDYRPGQSSSSSLLIRSSVLSTDAPSVQDSLARDGFLRTKARAVLAHSVPIGGLADEDNTLGVHISEFGSSIYLRNRRAKNPVTRAEYDKLRNRKRRSREMAKASKSSRRIEEEIAVPIDEEDVEAEEREKNERDKIKVDMQREADLLVPLLPEGSLMETIHYLTAHYYDARGMLAIRDGSAVKQTKGVNTWRVGEGSALIALAIYLEEVAKHQVENNSKQQENQNAKDDDAADQLKKYQKIVAKNRKRGGIKKIKIGKSTKMLGANGWARDQRRRRKRTKVDATSADLERSESGEESEGEEEEEEKEEDSGQQESSDGIDESDHTTSDSAVSSDE